MENLQSEIEGLKKLLSEKTQELEDVKSKTNYQEYLPCDMKLYGDQSEVPQMQQTQRLSNENIARYSRQLTLPEIGVPGQLQIQNSSVLIVGAGGLGCPAAIYLAAAGIGRIGLVDYDEVELSNLHRQILHSQSKVGVAKSASAAHACLSLNSSVSCIPYHLSLDSQNALDIIKQYDIVLDASDNVATRYLLNDACVLANKPLVSGSALRFEGQLTVYNYKGGPCYRCLFPNPPPPHTVTNCSDGGVLGVVPGVIGSLQALEAIKIAANMGSSYSGRLLLFDGLEASFRTIRLRGRQASCVVCGDQPTITRLIDYEQFCGAKASDKEKSLTILGKDDRISVKDYQDVLSEKKDHILVDVRLPVELDICSLPNPSFINIPIDHINKEEKLQDLKEKIEVASKKQDQTPVYVVCRRGNDSQVAVKVLRDKLKGSKITIQDIRGGLTAWAKQIDPEFPVY